jgi:TatD DNase family protein
MEFKAIDSHCHLHAAAYDSDRDVVLSKIKGANMAAITVGTNLAGSRDAVALAEANSNIWASVAVHPSHVYEPHHDKMELTQPPAEEFFSEKLFSDLLTSRRVVAIGETGLDHYRLPEDIDLQKTIKNRQAENFVAHIRTAKARKLPLILHVREAYAEALEILKNEKYFNGVMHCFTGSITEAEKFLEKGLFISFTGAITYPPKKGLVENHLHGVVRIVPLDRLLIETDAPWLTPVPLRGERNEPINVLMVAEKIAKIRGESEETIRQITAKNTVRLFNLASTHTP